MRKLPAASVTVIATAFLFGSSTSWADPIAITNPSFESTVVAEGGTGAATGWTGGSGVFYPKLGDFAGPNAFCEDNDPTQAFIDGIPDGNQIGWSNGSDISQDTTEIITEGFRYTLKVFVGGRCCTAPGFLDTSLSCGGPD